MENLGTSQTYGMVFAEGGDLWEGCERGWYWGEIEDAENEMLGDTVGPFETSDECEADFRSSIPLSLR